MTNRPTARQPTISTKNRFAAALCHVNRYSGNHTKILSNDTGISPHRLQRIMRGATEPTYVEVQRLVAAISTYSRQNIAVIELIVSEGEEFPTKFPCDLFDCRCHPPWAYNEDDEVRPEFKSIPLGKWTFEVPSRS